MRYYTYPLRFVLILSLLFLNVAAIDVSYQPTETHHLAGQANNLPDNPIMFVTQVPIPNDFTTIGSTFGNHRATFSSVGRGGDLWIRYPDGTLRNLTEEAGFNNSGFLNSATDGIAVREPSIHWNGTKAIFSMVIGTVENQFQSSSFRWQLYEVEGFAQTDPPGALTITKVPNQPTEYNNVSPIYGTDDRIIFTTDRPFNGEAHLYPQLDEYEEAPTVSGLWSMDPTVSGGDLRLLDHSPSGDFSPIIDSFGRVIFIRWDHLQRDQQADADAFGGSNGTFNFSDESASATPLFGIRDEVFPEPRQVRTDLLAGTNLNGHSFNHFFPWQMNEDGTEMEVLNHVGRHELTSGGFLNFTFDNDPNLTYFADPAGHSNPNRLIQDSGGMFHIKEDPTTPGLYFGTNAREFGSHSGGQIISLTGGPSLNGDQMVITYYTHPDTQNMTDTPSAEHSGLYRNPVPLANGSLIAAHTAETRSDTNEGSVANPLSRYDFRLKTMTQTTTADGTYWVADQALTSGLTKTVSYWNPDTLVQYNSVVLWELDPVEVRAYTIPTTSSPTLPAPEQQIFNEESVDPADLRTYLEANNLALVVSRDVTVRDDLDRQQPFNLKIAHSDTQTIGASGKIYDISYLQFFQGDMIRGIRNDPDAGRRVLAQTMHDTNVNNPSQSCVAPPGSVLLGDDGSMAAFVPAQRALSWQLTDSTGTGVVRERFWLTFQPGEMRVCASCHGLNNESQAGGSEPTNPPEALRVLLQYWQDNESVAVTCNQIHLPTVLKN